MATATAPTPPGTTTPRPNNPQPPASGSTYPQDACCHWRTAVSSFMLTRMNTWTVTTNGAHTTRTLIGIAPTTELADTKW